MSAVWSTQNDLVTFWLPYTDFFFRGGGLLPLFYLKLSHRCIVPEIGPCQPCPQLAVVGAITSPCTFPENCDILSIYDPWSLRCLSNTNCYPLSYLSPRPPFVPPISVSAHPKPSCSFFFKLSSMPLCLLYSHILFARFAMAAPSKSEGRILSFAEQIADNLRVWRRS